MGLFDRPSRDRSSTAGTSALPTQPGRPHVPLDGSTVRIDIRDLTSTLAAEGEDRALYLAVLDGAARGQAIPLGAEVVTVGRSAPAQFVLPDTRVSRSHCSVQVSAGQVLVTDLGSTNGSMMDGERISDTRSLRLGATLRVGDHLLKLYAWSPGELADWQRTNAPEEPPQGAADIRIDIDEDQRQQDVHKITSSQYFKGLAAEIESLRGPEDEQP